MYCEFVKLPHLTLQRIIYGDALSHHNLRLYRYVNLLGGFLGGQRGTSMVSVLTYHFLKDIYYCGVWIAMKCSECFGSAKSQPLTRTSRDMIPLEYIISPAGPCAFNTVDDRPSPRSRRRRDLQHASWLRLFARSPRNRLPDRSRNLMAVTSCFRTRSGAHQW